MRLLRYSGAQSSPYSSSSSYSVGTVPTKPYTFELRMRLLQYATTTQDRENKNGRTERDLAWPVRSYCSQRAQPVHDRLA